MNLILLTARRSKSSELVAVADWYIIPCLIGGLVRIRTEARRFLRLS